MAHAGVAERARLSGMASPTRSDDEPVRRLPEHVHHGADEAELRLSDADRLEVIEWLQQATGEGRLSLDEFSERVELVFAAQTASALAPAVAGLPAPPPSPPGAPAPRPPARRSRGRRRRRVVAVLGGSDRKGRWQLHRRTTAFALMGGVTLDLRGAAIEDAEVDIRCWAILGGVDVIVPEGVPVDFGGFVLMGGRDEKIAPVPLAPGAPMLRVRGYGMWGSVDVTSKPDQAADRPLVQEVRHRLRSRLDRVLPAPAPPAAGGVAAAPGTVHALLVSLAPVRAGGGPGARRRVARQLEEANGALVRGLAAQPGVLEARLTEAGALATFSSARSALRAAAASRAALAQRPAGALELRAGVHGGEVEGPARVEAVCGVAAALARAAGPGEVLVSGVVADLAGDSGEFRFGHVRALLAPTAPGGPPAVLTSGSAQRARALLER